jgi:adenylate cyclase
VREGLADGLDVSLEDLGECFLKHVDGSVRAYRVGAPGPAPLLWAPSDYSMVLEPTIAVIPFEARQQDMSTLAIGDAIADGVIAQVSRDRHLRVISRLSSAAFRGRQTSLRELATHLGLQYALTGSYGILGDRVLVHYELCEVARSQVLDSGRVTGQVADLLELESTLIGHIVEKISGAILREALQRVQTRPLPTLESYALLLGAIQLLHRSTPQGFTQSRGILDYLVDKHPRVAEPRVWLAKWHALRAVQETSVDRVTAANQALSCTHRVLDAEPTNAFALAMQGFVHCHLTMDYDAAMSSLQSSIASNRSESLAHLFHGLMQGMRGEFPQGIASFEEAVRVSPIDPEAYMIESIGGYLHLGAYRYDEAIALARRSLRRNRLHAHSWRVLTIALAETGQHGEAERSLREVLALQPALTVASYLSGARPDDATRKRFARGLQAAGLATA